ncbi:MAG TPA: hypothetical protein VFR34_10165 [Paracoccaceae bacterium]|nr:hypothetical protein [Paracoccaceae bacterium]
MAASPIFALLAGLALLTAGCAERGAEEVAARRGETPVTAAQAVETFRQICVETAPDFAGAAAAMGRAGMVADPSGVSGFHPELDLAAQISAAAATRLCAVEFRTPDSPYDLDRRAMQLRVDPTVANARMRAERIEGARDLYRLELVLG